MSNTPLPYPVPILTDGVNTAGVHAHFKGLKADPPPQLRAAWMVIVYRRMAGQNVDQECAELLHLERQYNTGKPLTAETTDDAPKAETPAQRAIRQFKDSQRGK
jgi:hypothetical protein